MTPKYYEELQIKCYICNRDYHISIDCPNFKRKRGNLIKLYNKLRTNTTSKFY